MNLDNLKECIRVMEHVRDNPKPDFRFDMSNWIETIPADEPLEDNFCGTTACFAGTVALALPHRGFSISVDTPCYHLNGNPFFGSHAIQAFMDCDSDVATALCFFAADYGASAVERAIERLEYLLKHGEKEFLKAKRAAAESEWYGVDPERSMEAFRR